MCLTDRKEEMCFCRADAAEWDFCGRTNSVAPFSSRPNFEMVTDGFPSLYFFFFLFSFVMMYYYGMVVCVTCD